MLERASSVKTSYVPATPDDLTCDEVVATDSDSPVGSVWVWAGAALVLPISLLVAVAVQRRFTYDQLFSEPSTSMGFHPLIGAVSTIGLIGWSAAAGMCALAWAVSRRSVVATVLGETRFYLFAGLGTLYLAVDDAFALHETLLPNRILPVSERYIFVAYFVVAAAFVVSSAGFIRRNTPGLFLAACLLLASSALLDGHLIARTLGSDYETPFVRSFLEDGLKLLGITLWLTYVTRTTLLTLTPSHIPPIPPLPRARVRPLGREP